jgi:hypothetical protein
MAVGQEVFLQQILEDRDQLYREASRLRSQLSSFENFEKERVSYQLDLPVKLTSSRRFILTSVRRSKLTTYFQY